MFVDVENDDTQNRPREKERARPTNTLINLMPVCTIQQLAETQNN